MEREALLDNVNTVLRAWNSMAGQTVDNNERGRNYMKFADRIVRLWFTYLQAGQDGPFGQLQMPAIEQLNEHINTASTLIEETPRADLNRLIVISEQLNSQLKESFQLVNMSVARLDEDPPRSWLELQIKMAVNEAVDAIGETAGMAMQAERRTLQQLQDDAKTARAELDEALRSASESATESDKVLVEARSIRDEALAARDEAKKAAGDTGAQQLISSFETYADKKLMYGAIFRAVTIVVLIVAIGVAFAFVLGFDLMLFPDMPRSLDANDWHQVTYRIAILGGLAGLSAYLGRQAGHYRRLGEWGRSIEVQLTSFIAFMTPDLTDDTRNAIYTSFSQRVFGAPPEPGAANSKETVNLLQPVIEVLSKTRPSA